MLDHSTPTPRLVSLATATPRVRIEQAEVTQRASQHFAAHPEMFEWIAPIYRNAGIDSRASCVPTEWYLEDHSFTERNDLFLAHAEALLAEAATQALDEAGVSADEIDLIVTVSTTGIATPSLDARLMRKLAFRSDVERLPVFGLGCAGGVLGLARAAAMATAKPGSRVLLLVVELCGLTFRNRDRSKSNLVATALFGDGAVAAVVSCHEDYADKPRLGPWGEHTWPDSLGVMGWDVADDGLKVVFSRDIPALVRSDLRGVIDQFLATHGATLADIDDFVCHPGGAKVLDALEDCFEQPRGALALAREVLRQNGNMSAATVLFVLRDALAAGITGPQLMTTLGPGFTAGLMIVRPA